LKKHALKNGYLPWRHLKFEFCVENIVCSSVSVCNFWKLFEKEFQEVVVLFFWFQVEMRLKKGKEKKNDTLSRENALIFAVASLARQTSKLQESIEKAICFQVPKKFLSFNFPFPLNLCPKFCHLFRIRDFRFL